MQVPTKSGPSSRDAKEASQLGSKDTPISSISGMGAKLTRCRRLPS